MSVDLTWHEIAVRLALTFVAGALVGINRGEHARPAGLRTTVLLCLAASVAMIQTNLLLHTVGKTADSFVVMDLMRLPLGILTGVGFIGAGAIWRRNDLVVGVTTAATLWFVTVMGLCFGGGQMGLGLAAFAICMLVLSGLKLLEEHCRQERKGTLIMSVEMGGPDRDKLSRLLGQSGCKIVSWSLTFSKGASEREYACAVRWHAFPSESGPPPFVDSLIRLPGVNKFTWKPD
jgi:putative Mg2+ transporter-C (MgtC) family protein